MAGMSQRLYWLSGDWVAREDGWEREKFLEMIFFFFRVDGGWEEMVFGSVAQCRVGFFFHGFWVLEWRFVGTIGESLQMEQK